jgi:putative N6-adenine-specific DNA methylase
MNCDIFLPCAAGVEHMLADEVRAILATTLTGEVRAHRAGVQLRGGWDAVLRLNLHSRLAQRVLLQLAHAPYSSEQDLYALAQAQCWEDWFGARQRIKVEVTAQRSPLKSLNFAALRIKDAICDRLRERTGARPDVDTRNPDVRIYLHLDARDATLYLDTSGEPLFKRGWREDRGDAPLKETLAAAMLTACGWAAQADTLPLYDPCCGSGTLLIEAAQMQCRMAAGLQRRFGFEHLASFPRSAWATLQAEARAAVRAPVAPVRIFGSDVAHRMVDFAQRNARRAGVAQALELRGGDALQRLPPCAEPGILLLNPPYGERIDVAGVAATGRERLQHEAAQGDFFLQLAAHWKRHFSGWQGWVLTPDLRLPGRMRLRESRRVPLWNGPIECRLFGFTLQARREATTPDAV